MGNRAIITTRENFNNNGIGVYLHWNGGRDSVEAFLYYCKLKGYRPPEKDCYGWARLCQVIGNFFGGTTSIGIDNFPQDVGKYQDNGTYIIENWEIIDRKYYNYTEQNNYDLHEMLLEIDKAQPVEEQIKEVINANEKSTTQLNLNDTVLLMNFDGSYKKFNVIGFGKDELVNGQNVKNVPYVNKCCDAYTPYSQNLNNYITAKTVFVI